MQLFVCLHRPCSSGIILFSVQVLNLWTLFYYSVPRDKFLLVFSINLYPILCRINSNFKLIIVLIKTYLNVKINGSLMFFLSWCYYERRRISFGWFWINFKWNQMKLSIKSLKSIHLSRALDNYRKLCPLSRSRMKLSMKLCVVENVDHRRF